MSESALEFKTTETFDKSFAALPPNLRKRTLEKLTPYETNPHHPSLRVKEDIWEMRVSKSYRITFQREGETVLLRNIETHEILRRAEGGD